MPAAPTLPTTLLLTLAVGGLLGCCDRRVHGPGPCAAPALPETAERLQGSDVAAWIEVHATRADGTPARGATAYAVRVGRASRTVMPDWPSAKVDDAGRARIPVPAAGTYDVGVVFPAAEEPRVLVADVRIDAGAAKRVEARLPALASVEVSLEGDDRPEVSLYANETGEPGSRVSYFPARGERQAQRWSFGVYADRMRLPEDVPYEVLVQEWDGKGAWNGMNDDWTADPAVVRAPGRVVLRRAAATDATIEVPVRLAVTGAVPPGLVRSTLRIRYAEGTPDEQEVLRTLEWKDGRAADLSSRIRLGARPAMLTWSGDGVEPGEALLPAASRPMPRSPRIEISIRGDDLPFLEGIDVESGGSPPRPDSPRLHATGPDPELESLDFYTEHEDRSADLRAGWKAIVEWGAWWVSRPVTIPRRGRAKFTLVPGGYLLATSSRVPTAGLGALTVRRADGAWLGERSADEIQEDVCDGESAGTARPGAIFGPFPEGDVELIVSLGDEERARIVPRVRANAITPFNLDW